MLIGDTDNIIYVKIVKHRRDKMGTSHDVLNERIWELESFLKHTGQMDEANSWIEEEDKKWVLENE